MNKVDMKSNLLLEMQKMAQAAKQSPLSPMEQALKTENSQPVEFSSLFKQAIDNVNSVQKESGALKKAFEMGDPNVDLPQVMVASQKASVAFTATVEVRNKLVEAYKSVMSMSV